VDEGAAVKRWSFSTMQAVVGLVTGLISIVGAAYSAVDTFRTATPPPGAIVVALRDAADKPVSAAVVEILGPENSLVTTMVPGDDGIGRRAIVAGSYRLRVVHPAFVEAERSVKVEPDADTDVRLVLATKPGHVAPPAPAARTQRTAPPQRARRSSPDEVADAVDRGIGEGRRILSRFGF
jgi:hypothetical protein